jgi:hypothetical protein
MELGTLVRTTKIDNKRRLELIDLQEDQQWQQTRASEWYYKRRERCNAAQIVSLTKRTKTTGVCRHHKKKKGAVCWHEHEEEAVAYCSVELQEWVHVESNSTNEDAQRGAN